MDPLFLLVAFLLGLAASRVGLPPLAGFLAAGFALNALGAESGPVLEEVADLGVILLLFTIGLKLRVRSLLAPEVWAGASIHMLLVVVLLGAGVLALATLGLSAFAGLDLGRSLLIAFALSFSSTVFAVKSLEEKGEGGALHGRVAIGILIMQDVIAVVFLTVSTGKLPSPWAIAVLVGLFVVRPILLWILERCGHGELLVLFGFFLALIIGAAGFEMVNLKPDLGALLVGMLLAPHPKAKELATSLMSFKDIFLVGFFLTIGLAEAPDLTSIGVAALLVIVLPIKVALFLFLFTRFRLRARTSLLASLSLATYSEFGLIVGAVGVKAGWIGSEWLVTIAIALSVSFVAAAPLNAAGHQLYERFGPRLLRLQSEKRRAGDEPIDPGDAEIVVFGMGRVGAGAYDVLRERYGDVVLGIERNEERVRRHRATGRKVILGDGTDSDFWSRVNRSPRIRLVLLALADHHEIMTIMDRLPDRHEGIMLAATAQHDDEIEALREAGVDAAFNFYAEAGAGFAEHVSAQFDARSGSSLDDE